MTDSRAATAARLVLKKAGNSFRVGSELHLLEMMLADRDALITQLREVNRGGQFSNSMIILGRTHPELARAMRQFHSDALGLVAKITETRHEMG